MTQKDNFYQRFSLIQLSDFDFPPILKILTSAFQNDPLILHMFPKKSRTKNIYPFFEFLLMKSILLNELLFGLEWDGKLVAVANLEVPSPKKPKFFQICTFIYQCLRLIFRIPFKSFVFMNSYMKSILSARPKEPHHYLVFIGVDPVYQGKGLGRLLLEHIHAQVDQHPDSSGIGLDTENLDNVHLYERFAYDLICIDDHGTLKIYNMFRLKTQNL